MSEPFVGELRVVIARALSDQRFRTALATNPEQTLAKAGLKVTPDQLKAIALAQPANWGGLTLEDVIVRIDTMSKKR